MQILVTLSETCQAGRTNQRQCVDPISTVDPSMSALGRSKKNQSMGLIRLWVSLQWKHGDETAAGQTLRNSRMCPAPQRWNTTQVDTRLQLRNSRHSKGLIPARAHLARHVDCSRNQHRARVAVGQSIHICTMRPMEMVSFIH